MWLCYLFRRGEIYTPDSRVAIEMPAIHRYFTINE